MLSDSVQRFEQIASALHGCTETVVISFIDLFPKVRRNFPEAREVEKAQRLRLGKEMIRIASLHGMTVKPCADGDKIHDVPQKSWVNGQMELSFD